MKQNKNIHDAIKRMPTPTLSDDFVLRTMQCIKKQRHHQRREIVLTTICIATYIAAMSIYGLFTLVRYISLDMQWINISVHFENTNTRFWAIIAIGIVAVLIVDIYLRRWIQRRYMKQ